MPPSDSAPPLQLQNVVKRFRQGNAVVDALAGIDLTVHRGEFVAVMGASGSGKSTLLHATAGLTDINSGTISVEGRSLAGLSDAALTKFRRRRIGLVFQAFNLVPTLTAEDNIRLPAVERAGLDERVDALLDRLGIAVRRRHRPDALSGGEQQRVAIARALVTEPAIVLADEPTGSLDSATGQSICHLLRELCEEQGRTIVVVTHEQAVAKWAQRVVTLRDGRVMSDILQADVLPDRNGSSDLFAGAGR
ncbi:MAG: ABC transporter ATP-binding protein [Tepidisphaeraceae bacterium]